MRESLLKTVEKKFSDVEIEEKQIFTIQQNQNIEIQRAQLAKYFEVTNAK